MSDKNPVPEMRQADARDANFVLFVLNASQKSPRLEIQVRIDGKLAVAETFSSEAPESLKVSLQPTKVFHFRLAPGTHTLVATAGGFTRLEEHFELAADKRWALLGYDYWSGTTPQPPPGRFEFTVQNTPIYFQ